MKNLNKNNLLFQKVSALKGIGKKLEKYLKNKKIEKVKDLILDLPYEIVDRSIITSLDKLEIGKITTIEVLVEKYNFPRVRNLPNRVVCSQNNKKIDIVFFNSREGYIKKVLPLGKLVVISGKINFYKQKYQITNPTYFNQKESKDKVAKVFPKYSMTEGLNEKIYRNMIHVVLNDLNSNEEWHSDSFLNANKFNSFKKTMINLHNPLTKKDIKSHDYRRLVYDEIFSNLIYLSTSRKIIRTKKTKSFK